MPDLWRSASRGESLDRFLDEDDPAGCASILRATWPSTSLSVDDLGSEWLPGDKWVRRLRVQLDGTSGGADRFELHVPWLVDDDAHARATFDGLGGHPGTYWGRPGWPVATMALAPDIRLLVTQLKGRLKVELELVPTRGPAARIELDDRTSSDAVAVLRVRGRSAKTACPLGAAAEKVPALLSGFGLDFDPHLLANALNRLCGVDPDAGRESIGAGLGPDDVDALLAVLAGAHDQLSGWRRGQPLPELPPLAVTAMDRSRWRVLEYGDLLGQAVRAGARRAKPQLELVQEDKALRGISTVASPLNRELANLAAGRGRYSSAMVSDRQTNALARLELAREHSFIGPAGLEEYNGRMDLRVLPPEWEGLLCPVQTPESKKVGLTRYAAIEPEQDDGSPLNPYVGLSVCVALVPFVNHDDPTRTAIGAKMLKQALLLDAAEPPIVRTGVERDVAESIGVARSDRRATVEEVRTDSLLLRGSRGSSVLRFGPPRSSRQVQDDRWSVRVGVGDRVLPGDPVAVAPEASLDPAGQGQLQLGLNALVGFVPWHGWNFEDGVVVSESFAKRMTSRHLVHVSVDLTELQADDDIALTHENVLDPGTDCFVPAESSVGFVVSADRKREIMIDEDAHVVLNRTPGPYRYLTRTEDEVRATFEVVRPLEVGDKVTTRHGGKGVVTRVLPDDEMPRLPDGSVLEALLNPLGVLRRLNLGAVLEVNEGLLARLGGADHVEVPRALGADGRAALAGRLAAAGVPGGRVRLVDKDGHAVGPAEGAVAGPLYLLKLHHVARRKLSSRHDGGPSSTNFQPSQGGGFSNGRKVGRPQRLGEMELWALQAIGAEQVLADLLTERGVGARDLRKLPGGVIAPGLRAVAGQLAVAGFHLEADVATPKGAAVHDLTVNPAVDLRSVQGIRLVYRGASAERPGLRNILELKVEASQNPDLRESPSAEVMAEEILRIAVRPELAADAGARALARETTRFYIPLPEPVRHPWSFADGDVAFRLPGLLTIAVPPALVLGREPLSAVTRNHPLAATHRVLRQVLATGNRRDHEHLSFEVEWLLGRLRESSNPASVAKLLQGKQGLMRRNLLGSAAFRSGRAVLAGDPTLDPEEVGLPESMAHDLGIAADSALGVDNPDSANVVLVNRQPTLHPYNIVALKARRSVTRTVTVHPHVLAALAGDFDGDTAAVHRTADPTAADQLWELCRPAMNVRTSAQGTLIAKVDLDVALGHQVLREGDHPELAAPDAEPSLAGVGRPLLDELVARMAKGFEVASRWGFTVADLPRVEVDAHLTDDEAVETLLASDDLPTSSVRTAFRAGAAGKPADLLQIFVRRGQGMLPNEFLSATDIDSYFLDGLDDASYFEAAQVSVGLLAAKKLVTPYAGSLTQRLVNLGYEVVIGAADCGGPSESRSPLTCADDQPCQACYGPDLRTDRAPAPGLRVGVLAGMLIGERSTQLAMKSIHQRGQAGALRDNIEQLEGIFGARSVLLGERSRTDVAKLLNQAFLSGSPAAEGLAPLVNVFEELLPSVHVKHAQVLLRRLADGHRRLVDELRDGEGDLTEGVRLLRRPQLVRAASEPSTLEALAVTGDLRVLLRAAASEQMPPTGPTHLAALVTGALGNG